MCRKCILLHNSEPIRSDPCSLMSVLVGENSLNFFVFIRFAVVQLLIVRYGLVQCGVFMCNGMHYNWTLNLFDDLMTSIIWTYRCILRPQTLMQFNNKCSRSLNSLHGIDRRIKRKSYTFFFLSGAKCWMIHWLVRALRWFFIIVYFITHRMYYTPTRWHNGYEVTATSTKNPSNQKIKQQSVAFFFSSLLNGRRFLDFVTFGFH